jgi:hypothetical protein
MRSESTENTGTQKNTRKYGNCSENDVFNYETIEKNFNLESEVCTEITEKKIMLFDKINFSL